MLKFESKTMMELTIKSILIKDQLWKYQNPK